MGWGPSSIKSLKERFAALGARHSEVKSSHGDTALITLRDPDNIQVEVFGGPLDPTIAQGRAGS